MRPAIVDTRAHDALRSAPWDYRKLEIVPRGAIVTIMPSVSYAPPQIFDPSERGLGSVPAALLGTLLEAVSRRPATPLI